MKKFHEKAKVPVKKNKNDACWDIYAVEETKIEPGQKVRVRTGLGLQASRKRDGHPCSIHMKSRSSYMFGKWTLTVFPGVIDYDYPDEILVLIENRGDELFVIKEGDRFVQFSAELVREAEFKVVDEFAAADRKGGFGSTGKK